MMARVVRKEIKSVERSGGRKKEKKCTSWVTETKQKPGESFSNAAAS